MEMTSAGTLTMLSEDYSTNQASLILSLKEFHLREDKATVENVASEGELSTKTTSLNRKTT